MPDVSKTDAVSERHHGYIWSKIQEGCYCAGCLSSWAVTAATRHQVTLLWVLRAGRHTKDDAYRFVGNPKVFQLGDINTCSGSRSPMWSQVALNPSDGCWMLASNCREFWVGLTYLAISISREATLREKVCCKSFPFSPFVNCANACVQLWHSPEVDLFKQSQESTLKSNSLAQFGSRSQA